MTPTVVFVNDAAHAQAMLRPVMAQSTDRRWVVVVCAPRLTRRIGKFSSQQSRKQWRAQWAQRLRERLGPGLQMFDARKPRLGAGLESPERQAQPESPRWLAPIAVSSGMSLVLALAD
jgi:hypothetical protein